MQDKSSMLRKLAMQAKKRLNGASKEKQSCPKKDLSTMTIYKNLYKNNFKIISYIDNEEEFYLKVKKILSMTPDSPNILKQLVDQNEYARLDDAQKIGYMLNLAERYARVKQRIDEEKYVQKEYKEMSM